MLTQQQLETHLWSCANKLRGSIDSQDFKDYILTLMFYKRLADQWECEAEQAVRKMQSGTTELTAAMRKAIRNDPDFHQHRISIPAGCFWQDIVSTPTHQLGQKLNHVMGEVGSANPQLDAVFRAVDWNATVNDSGIQKPRIGNEVLHDLVQEFSTHNLSNDNVDVDVLGRAYEYLILKFADDAGAKGGEFYTPREVVQVLVRILKPSPTARVYDPTCGSGGMLVYSAEHVRRQDGPDGARKMKLFGQERNWNTWAIARMNMVLHDLEAEIRGGASTLTDPQFTRGEGQIDTFDVVIANFPFSDANWGHERLKEDPFGRMRYGMPPSKNGDFAFLQHIVASMNETGRAGVVCSQGVLFRGNAEGKIRRAMLKEDLLEAVVGLPSNLFYGNTIPGCLLFFNRCKPQERRGKVLFIYAAKDYEELSNQNRLRPQDVDRIVAAFEAGQDEERYCRLVAMDEIAENDYNLNIPRYVDTFEPEEPVDMPAAVAALGEAEAAREEAMKTLRGYLEELGL
ncbi:type I restriction-modification system subunit M [bacterium]|nr:type I restriction-modification system subunit M [bacterium]